MNSDWDEKQARRLLKRLRSVPEPSMRKEVLTRWFDDRDPDWVLAFFVFVLEGAQRRKPLHLVGLEVIGDWLFQARRDASNYERLSELYRLAKENDHDAVGNLLLQVQAKLGPLQKQQIPWDMELARLSLGERKFLARKHNRDVLERLLLDPEPAVVRNLLRNPKLTQQDVLRLVTRRPVRDEVLTEVYVSKWGVRYAIRVGLVSNPYTPTELSLKLVDFLLYKDLQKIASDLNLHQLVRSRARQNLQTRRAKSTKKH